jgi:hypothetical protein
MQNFDRLACVTGSLVEYVRERCRGRYSSGSDWTPHAAAYSHTSELVNISRRIRKVLQYTIKSIRASFATERNVSNVSMENYIMLSIANAPD